MIKICDRVVGAIQQRDVDKCLIPLIVLYDHPQDYPDHIVARLWDIETPTNTVMIRRTAEEMHEAIRKLDDVVFMPRLPKDDKTIIGVYFC